MKVCEGTKPNIQNSYSMGNDRSWSPEERQALTAFFLLLYEIDQQTDVTKEYADANK
jgi:phytoene/squalene synthetase